MPPARKGGHQDQSQERSPNSAQVVHGALEPIGAPVGFARHSIGKQRVSRRHTQPAGRPSTGSQQSHLPHGLSRSDQGRQECGLRIATYGCVAASPGIVGQGTTQQTHETGHSIGQAFDQAQGGSGGAESGGEKVREQGGGHLMAEIGQKTRRTDASYPCRQPGALFGRVPQVASLQTRSLPSSPAGRTQ